MNSIQEGTSPWPCSCEKQTSFYLSTGAFSTVCQQCEHVARKEMYKDDDPDEASLLREIEIFRRIGPSPPHIVEFYGHIDIDTRYFRLHPAGDIPDYFFNVLCGNVTLTSVKTRWQWAIDIAEALVFLHSHGIIHRDLSPSNMLLSDDRQHAVLCDFGSSHYPEGPPIYVGCTPGFSLSIQNDPPCFSQDHFAFGCTVFYIMMGRAPFCEILEPDQCAIEGDHRVPNMVIKRKYQSYEFPSFPDHFPNSLAQHIRKCWSKKYQDSEELLVDFKGDHEEAAAMNPDPWNAYKLLDREELLEMAINIRLPETTK